MRIITSSSLLLYWTARDAVSLARHADNLRIAATMRDAFRSPYTPDDVCRFIAMAPGDRTCSLH